MKAVSYAIERYRRPLILLQQLVITDFKLRYQGSAIGYLWSLFRPLFLFSILLIIFDFFLKIGSDVPYYPVYLLLGIVLWNFFIEATSNGMKAIVDRGDLIRKINFPKYIIVVASSLSALINLAISMGVVVIFALFFKVDFHWSALLFPLLALELYILALGSIFVLSALYVKFRDLNYIWELVLQAGFYATPILYPLSKVLNENVLIGKLIMLNPMAQIIQDSRYVLVTNQTQTIWELYSHSFLAGLPIVIVLLLVVVGSLRFKAVSKYFAETV